MVQVIIAVCCAVVISGVIFACIICLRRRKSSVRRKSSLGHFFITNDAPSPFGIASLNSQLYRSQSEDNKNAVDDTNYNTFMYSEEYPQEEYSELDLSDRSSTPSGDRSSTPSGSDIIETTLSGSPQSDKSLSDMNKISAIKKLRMMRRAKSMGNLTSGVASGVIYRPDNDTVLTLCLDYHQANSVLNIDLQDAMDLPSKTHNSEVFITAHLFPKSNEGINTKVVPVDEIVHFDEILQFSNVSLQDLEHCTIRLSLFSKKKSKPKTNFIGEAFIQCTEINIKSPSPTRMEVVLQRKRLKKVIQEHPLCFYCKILQYKNLGSRVNKLILDTRIEILYLRQTRVSSSKDSSVTLEWKKRLKGQIKYEVEVKAILNSVLL